MKTATYKCHDCLSSGGCTISVEYNSERGESGHIDAPKCVCYSGREAEFRLVSDE